MTPPPFSLQLTVLSARYRACIFGDLGALSLLVLQAPFIGWLCTLVWGSVETDTPSLYFVMCLSAVWFGCINACREIVKERDIVERERLLGLSCGAYILSRLQVLAILGLIQVLLLQIAIEFQLSLRGFFWFESLALWGASLCGTGLGLVVSAISKTQERAVGAIPLLILPQILFSEFAIPRDQFGTLVEWVERIMPVKWAYHVFTELAASETEWLSVLGAFAMLILMSLALTGLATLALLPKRSVL